MTLPIIGFSGLPNCGKDTSANYLVRTYKYSKLSFAQPIRENVYKVFHLDTSLMNDRHYESQPLPQLGGKTVKMVLQLYNRLCTDVYDGVWVDNTFRDLDLTQRWVIADVRKPLEVQQIKASGGIHIYIHSNRPIPDDGRDMAHESESYHDYLRTHADYHLLNDYPDVDSYLRYLATFIDNILHTYQAWISECRTQGVQP